MPTDFSNPIARPIELEAGPHAILFIHGFTGSPSHMRYTADAVHQAGYSVRSILLPGHGTTIEDMAHSSGAQWWDACRAAYEEMLAKYKTVSVAGLSLGGVLSLLLAETYKPQTLILFAAAIKYKRALNRLSPAVKYVMPVLHSKPRGYDPDTFLYDYDYGYTSTPVTKVEDMSRLQTEAREGLNKVTCPALAFQSHLDDSVHHEAPELIMRGVSSQVKEICWVDRSPHVLTIGPDRDYVCARVIDFLGRYTV